MKKEVVPSSMIQKQHKAYLDAANKFCESTRDLIQASWDFGDSLTKQWRAYANDEKFEAFVQNNKISLSDAWACVKVRSLGEREDVLSGGNILRQAMLCVAIPKREEPEADSQHELCQPVHYMPIAKAFTSLQRKIESNLVTIDPKQAREDLRPLWEWLSQFFNEVKS